MLLIISIRNRFLLLFIIIQVTIALYQDKFIYINPNKENIIYAIFLISLCVLVKSEACDPASEYEKNP